MIRSMWTRNAVAWTIVISLLPVLAVLLVQQGVMAAERVVIGIAVIAAWQLLFRLVSGVPMSPTAAVSALALAVLAPGALALWQLIWVLSFGTVIGELVFGGWGRNFISAATVTLAFLFVSFPDIRQEPSGGWIVLACASSAVMLLVTGILAWQVLAAALAAVAATLLALGGDLAAMMSMGSVAFGLVFLVGDPVTSPSTRGGRLVYGALSGALTVLLGHRFNVIDAPQAVVFAALIAAIFAPLIDHAAIALWAWRRRMRYG